MSRRKGSHAGSESLTMFFWKEDQEGGVYQVAKEPKTMGLGRVGTGISLGRFEVTRPRTGIFGYREHWEEAPWETEDYMGDWRR